MTTSYLFRGGPADGKSIAVSPGTTQVAIVEAAKLHGPRRPSTIPNPQPGGSWVYNRVLLTYTPTPQYEFHLQGVNHEHRNQT